jgi:hypothetical protein
VPMGDPPAVGRVALQEEEDLAFNRSSSFGS